MHKLLSKIQHWLRGSNEVPPTRIKATCRRSGMPSYQAQYLGRFGWRRIKHYEKVTVRDLLLGCDMVEYRWRAYEHFAETHAETEIDLWREEQAQELRCQQTRFIAYPAK